jgi:hypothetical protein
MCVRLSKGVFHLNSKAAVADLRPTALVFVLFLLIPGPLFAQTSTASLSGTVTGPSGKAVSGATVTIKNLATDQTMSVQTNATGLYTESNLAPGEYQITVAAAGFDTKSENVTVTAGSRQTLDVTLQATLTLEDLGISPQQTEANPQEQARLNKRSHMLQVHQRLGLITTIPLGATVISGFFAGGKRGVTSSSSRDLHAALGSATVGLYAATAYYAIFAPKIPGTKTEGPIRFHKALAWIHGPGMILTPILGAMAFNQRSQGERVHGIAHYHGQVAIVTAVAYGLAILSVSVHSGAAARKAHAFFGLFHSDHSDSADATMDGAPAKAGTE